MVAVFTAMGADTHLESGMPFSFGDRGKPLPGHLDCPAAPGFGSEPKSACPPLDSPQHLSSCAHSWATWSSPDHSYPPPAQISHPVIWGRLNRLTFANKQPAILWPSVTSPSFIFCKEEINLLASWHFPVGSLRGRGGRDPEVGLFSGVGRVLPATSPRGPVSTREAGTREPAWLSIACCARRFQPRSNLLSLRRPREYVCRRTQLPSRMDCGENFP